jgi:hypothetical protein
LREFTHRSRPRPNSGQYCRSGFACRYAQLSTMTFACGVYDSRAQCSVRCEFFALRAGNLAPAAPAAQPQHELLQPSLTGRPGAPVGGARWAIPDPGADPDPQSFAATWGTGMSRTARALPCSSAAVRKEKAVGTIGHRPPEVGKYRRGAGNTHRQFAASCPSS